MMPMIGKPKAYRTISFLALILAVANFLYPIAFMTIERYLISCHPYKTPAEVVQYINMILLSIGHLGGYFLAPFTVSPFILLLTIIAIIFAAREAGRVCGENIVWVKWILSLAFSFIMCAFPATLNVFWLLAYESIPKPLWFYGYILPIVGIFIAIILIVIGKARKIKILRFQILPLSILILVAITGCLYFRLIFFEIEW